MKTLTLTEWIESFDQADTDEDKLQLWHELTQENSELAIEFYKQRSLELYEAITRHFPTT